MEALTKENLRLPKLISHNMVLQQKSLNHLWGWAKAGEDVEINFLGKICSTQCDDSGLWKVALDIGTNTESLSMTISTEMATQKIENIAIGDVWVCSGQSNMFMPMDRPKYIYQKEIAECENPWIRHFRVPEHYAFDDANDDFTGGNWFAAHPDTILDFSAAAYFFALELWKKHKTPIGLITAAVGGVPIEALMGRKALKNYPGFLELADQFREKDKLRQEEARLNAIYAQRSRVIEKNDQGCQAEAPHWHHPQLDDSHWQEIQIPGYWEKQGFDKINGVFWLRRFFWVDPALAGQKGLLNLGRIIDSDETYLNGQMVGTTGYQYPPRIYDVQPGLLKPGLNQLTLRVFSYGGDAGGFSVDKPYHLEIGGTRIDLTGAWKIKLGAALQFQPEGTRLQSLPTGIYNAMIAPLHSKAIKGVIFYQGESNADKIENYAELFQGLITDWRQEWKQGDFPFLFVQLPNYHAAMEHPGESDWAPVREAQDRALALPNTAMAVTLDLGEWNDIHPMNKKDVGKRLAMAAEHLIYRECDTSLISHRFKGLEKRGNQVIITFSPEKEALQTRDNKAPRHFAIAGKEACFEWAEAKIENNRVVLWHNKIADIRFIRYCWANNPAQANLCNSAGLPAAPFSWKAD
ncbi:MAG: hypothetical protein JXR70_19130 [Spirochaetales bacterium]|nr:hypothetical protein [Spirochaetales bacterium]